MPNITGLTCKILEKRYDADPKVPDDYDGWVVIDIQPMNYRQYYTDEQWERLPAAEKEELSGLERGSIFGWARKERCDEELEHTGFTKIEPLTEDSDPAILACVLAEVIPHEWKYPTYDPELVLPRLFVCTKP
jgi:hypothetical protein